MKTTPFLLLCLLTGLSHALSTGGYRLTAESAHFFITAEPDRAPLALEASSRLESAFDSLTKFFDFVPREKINTVLIDDEDYSNGFAYSANAWIVLYLPPARFELRGSPAWIPNVSAHELTHIITLRKMGRTSRFLGVEAFASLGFNSGRTDASVSWLPKDVPTWLAEGLAQYGSMQCGFDTLDSHRRMLLREAWKAGTLLPLKAMETFSGDGRQAETVYNQGFHLVDFLYRTRGRDAVNTMMEAWDKQGYGGAFRAAFGVGPEAIYAEWREEVDSLQEAGGEPKPLSKTGNVGAYRIETAPVRDARHGILYFLSSEPNDFGITHLYARTSKGTRRIKRNVAPPLTLSGEGSLLFTSVKTQVSTGARIGDLYRYTPAGGLERITRNLRAFAGAQAGSRVFALIHNKGGTRLARLDRNGRPDLWIDAPAGSEFSSLAAGDDSTLYVGVIRGKNSDILRANLRTGILSPVEASEHNEIDPVVHEGRLYFASDASGEYAVYSREGGAARRHTPAGVSAFLPFASTDSLWYSAYGAEGFHLAAAPLSGTTLEPAPAMPVDTSNRPFPPPRGASVKRLGYDYAGMEMLGYYATLGYASTPSRNVSNFYVAQEPEDVFRFNPCGQQVFAGGGSLSADPAERGSLFATVLAAQCIDGTPGAGFYLPEASLTYINRNHTPDLLFMGQYQALQVARMDGAVLVGTINEFQVISAAQYHLGDYFSNTPFLQIAGVRANLRQSESGGGLAAGNTFGFMILEPGVDYINQGVYADATTALSGGVGVFAADAGAFTSVQRRLFLGAQTDAFQTTQSTDSFNGGFLLSADLRFPLGIARGGAGYRGTFFESLFLRSGFSRRWNSGSGTVLTYGAPLWRNALRPAPLEGSGRSAASPVAQAAFTTPQTVRLGVRLKLISPGSRVVYWDADWQAPPDGMKDGYFSMSLSL